MTDTNATTLRNALAAAIKNHVTSNGLKAKDAADAVGMQYSRLSQILRGDVAKISSDALVNVLGGFGYRLTGITGSGDGTEIVLSLDKAEGHVLPEIENPVNPVEVLRPIVDGYAETLGIEVDHDAIDDAAAYVEQEVDTDASRVIADA